MPVKTDPSHWISLFGVAKSEEETKPAKEPKEKANPIQSTSWKYQTALKKKHIMHECPSTINEPLLKQTNKEGWNPHSTRNWNKKN